MTRYANSNGTLNEYCVRPDEVQTNDRYGYKVIAVMDEHFWTAYKGLTDWSDERTAAEGDSIPEEAAIVLFPSLHSTNRTYYR